MKRMNVLNRIRNSFKYASVDNPYECVNIDLINNDVYKNSIMPIIEHSYDYTVDYIGPEPDYDTLYYTDIEYIHITIIYNQKNQDPDSNIRYGVHIKHSRREIINMIAIMGRKKTFEFIFDKLLNELISQTHMNLEPDHKQLFKEKFINDIMNNI